MEHALDALSFFRRNRLVVFSLAVYFFLSAPGLSRPGLSIDESSDGIVSQSILRPPARGQRVIEAYVTVSGRMLPLMSGPYTGVVNDYFIYPFVRILGPTVVALRLPMILLAGAALLLLHESCAAWFGRRMAGLCLLLTATDLSFVQYSRLSLWREELPLAFILSGIFFSLSRYRAKPRAGWLYAGAFLLGAGLSSKITFFWYAVSLIAALAVVRPARPPLSRAQAAACALFLLAGALPLVAYNAAAFPSWPTVRLLYHDLLGLSPGVDLEPGVRNFHYLANLKLRAAQLWACLGGAVVQRENWGIGGSRVLDACLKAERLSIVVSLAIFFTATRNAAARFLSIFYAATFLQTPFTVSGFDPGHLAALIPLPTIAVAYAADRLWTRFGRAKGAALAGLLLLPALSAGAGGNLYYRAQLKANGGIGRWTTSITDLEAYLKEEKAFEPVVFGFVSAEDLVYLSGQTIRPKTLTEDSDAAVARFYRGLPASRPIYCLWSGTNYENKTAFDRFMATASKKGRRAALERTFANRAGQNVYWLYRLEPATFSASRAYDKDP